MDTPGYAPGPIDTPMSVYFLRINSLEHVGTNDRLRHDSARNL